MNIEAALLALQPCARVTFYNDVQSFSFLIHIRAVRKMKVKDIPIQLQKEYDEHTGKYRTPVVYGIEADEGLIVLSTHRAIQYRYLYPHGIEVETATYRVRFQPVEGGTDVYTDLSCK